MIVHRSVPEWLTMTVPRSVPEWLAMIVHRSVPENILGVHLHFSRLNRLSHSGTESHSDTLQVRHKVFLYAIVTLLSSSAYIQAYAFVHTFTEFGLVIRCTKFITQF